MKATNYACEDADITLRLWKIFKNLLVKNKLVKVYEYIERPLIKVILEMETNGIKINKIKLEELSSNFSDQLESSKRKYFQLLKLILI